MAVCLCAVHPSAPLGTLSPYLNVSEPRDALKAHWASKHFPTIHGSFGLWMQAVKDKEQNHIPPFFSAMQYLDLALSSQ